jgi:hypothetical protein
MPRFQPFYLYRELLGLRVMLKCGALWGNGVTCRQLWLLSRPINIDVNISINLLHVLISWQKDRIIHTVWAFLTTR